jgi:hypothetical protein
VAELAQRLHGEPAVAFEENGKGGDAVAIGKLAKDLREIGWMLLLKDIAEIRGCAYAQEALDRVQDEIDSPLRRHTEPVTLT